MLEPSRQNRYKVTLEEGVFVESEFNMQCHIHKNTLLHIALSAILPAGKGHQIEEKKEENH